jgi:hypothetical protein
MGSDRQQFDLVAERRTSRCNRDGAGSGGKYFSLRKFLYRGRYHANHKLLGFRVNKNYISLISTPFCSLKVFKFCQVLPETIFSSKRLKPADIVLSANSSCNIFFTDVSS